jgi:hypothetical protein
MYGLDKPRKSYDLPIKINYQLINFQKIPKIFFDIDEMLLCLASAIIIENRFD